MSKSPLPKVAIIGRPDVGKSTLFNRLVRKRKAIVHDEWGTTRDRLYETITWKENQFILIDTGGHKSEAEDELEELVNQEIQFAIEEADLLLFMIERDAISAEDQFILDLAKKRDKKIILVVNKIENSESLDYNDIYQLGLGDPILISAEHNQGIESLLDAVVEHIPEVRSLEKDDCDYALAIIGEPNSGKSTLLNGLLQKKRAITSEVAGTTRDSIEEFIKHEDVSIKLIDTAGIQRKKKIKDSTTFFSLTRATKSIEEANVVLLLFDATKGPQRDTRAIFDMVEELGKACLLVVNKWDLISNVEMHAYEQALIDEHGFLKSYPILFISALTGRNVDQLLDQTNTLFDRYRREIKTRELNEFLQKVKDSGKLPVKANVKYITQTGSSPPRFTVFMNNPKNVKESDKSFIRNQLVKQFEFEGIFPLIDYK